MSAKCNRFTIERTVHFPPKEKFQDGVLYFSKEFKLAAHLCACGCGGEVVTPIDDGTRGWTLDEAGPTLFPSIGNWSGERPYHAHYYIKNGNVEWC